MCHIVDLQFESGMMAGVPKYASHRCAVAKEKGRWYVCPDGYQTMVKYSEDLDGCAECKWVFYQEERKLAKMMHAMARGVDGKRRVKRVGEKLWQKMVANKAKNEQDWAEVLVGMEAYEVQLREDMAECGQECSDCFDVNISITIS